MTELPAPLTPPECDLRDEPVPFALLEAFAAAYGLPIDKVAQMALSTGMAVETRA